MTNGTVTARERITVKTNTKERESTLQMKTNNTALYNVNLHKEMRATNKITWCA